MDRFGVELALDNLREVMEEWKAEHKKALAAADEVMSRLVLEAARNRMSVDQVSAHRGWSKVSVRAFMRRMGLDPKSGRNLLANKAAETLNANAALMGIDPLKFDLSSPLAYLPAGRKIAEAAQSKAVRYGADVNEAEHIIHCTANTCCLAEIRNQ